MATRKKPKAPPPKDTRKRVRLALSPTPALQACLVRLGEATGKAPATVALDLLTELIPQMDGLAKLARAARSGNQAAAKRALVQMVGDSMAEVLSDQQPGLFKK